MRVYYAVIYGEEERPIDRREVDATAHGLKGARAVAQCVYNSIDGTDAAGGFIQLTGPHGGVTYWRCRTDGAVHKYVKSSKPEFDMDWAARGIRGRPG